VTVRQLLGHGRQLLQGTSQGSLEAEILLAHALGVSRAWLYANGEQAAPPDAEKRFLELAGRRAAGEPVAYLTGLREFWSLPLKVTPDVLIPRPETELLVEIALERLPAGTPFRVADLGTGSGAVALAIASERPLCEVHATELSPAALAVARKNAALLPHGRVCFHGGSWFEPLEGCFDLVVSNPPYVAEGDRHLAQGDCRFEPRAALTPGGDGLSAIKAIASDAPGYLVPGGCLAFEHGYDQGAAARALLEELGFVKIQTRQDLEMRDRVTLGYREN
jgi:release factor glutamine methyltransferase